MTAIGMVAKLAFDVAYFEFSRELSPKVDQEIVVWWIRSQINGK